MTRVATSVSLAVLLTLTTPWPRLLDALQALRVPQVFVLVTGMAYRYVFYAARFGRRDVHGSQGADGRPRVERQERAASFVSASAGALFARTYALSEEVHMAMVARGYRGSAHVDRASLSVARTG